MDVMIFNFQGHKTSTTKSAFYKLLGLWSGDVYSNFNLVWSSSIIRVYYQMGYNADKFFLFKFKKLCLPPVWNTLFAILFRCFSKRVRSSDNANKLFHILLYALYMDEKNDLVQIL